MRWLQRRLLPSTCVLCAVVATAAPPVDPAAVLARTPKVYRSPSGRIVVVGKHAGANLLVGKWADEVLARFEDVTELTCPLTRRAPLMITIPLEVPADAAAPAVRRDASGKRLVVSGPMATGDIVADAGLCACLLDLWIANTANTPPAGRGSDDELPDTPVPDWLAVGIARNLYPERRAAAAGVVLAAWERGQLPPLLMCLTADTERADASIRACWALFVGAIADAREGGDWLRDVLTSAAAGRGRGPASPRVRLFPELTPDEIEVWWDGVILEERRVVRRPGRLTAEGRRRFEAALLLYPGTFGMPLSHELYDPFPWEMLIARRDERWVPSFCRRKLTALHVMAAGRGRVLQETAAAFGAFLRGLADGESERVLRRALADARAQLDALRSAPVEE